MPDILRIYLPNGPRDRAEAGKHELVNRLHELMPSLGISVELRPVTLQERVASVLRDEYAIILMAEPWHARMLTLRRAYLHPFWRIETGAERWHFEVAQRRFDPAELDQTAASDYVQALRNRRFGASFTPVSETGFILVPLQGHLLQRRSFQMASPLEMLGDVLRHAKGRTVVATLHPTETYSSADHAALTELAREHGNFRLGTEPSEAYLPGCDFVVTQNSGTALMGFFFHKPAILYARSDFHHIAANVRDLGVEGAFQVVATDTPDFDKYITWFLRDNSINAGRIQSTARILATLRRRGWEI